MLRREGLNTPEPARIMTSLWPWFVVAGVGALHGLHPATGWAFAAAWGLRTSDRSQALRALVPIAAGHTASIALVAGAVMWGVAVDRVVLQVLGGALFALAMIAHLSSCIPEGARSPAGHAGLALWSFMVSTAHGAGLMLVPALVPLCAGETSVLEMTESGPLTLALAAVAIHTASMLVVTGLVAMGVCRGFDAGACLLKPRKEHCALGMMLANGPSTWAP